jgi:hypothetical protein
MGDSKVSASHQVVPEDLEPLGLLDVRKDLVRISMEVVVYSSASEEEVQEEERPIEVGDFVSNIPLVGSDKAIVHLEVGTLFEPLVLANLVC